jgi:hypothetical protein
MFVATSLAIILTLNSFARAEALVARLGDPSFAVRERVGAELVQLARAALPALRRGQTHRDWEIAERCKRLIPTAEVECTRQRIIRLSALAKADRTSPLPFDEFLLRRFLTVTGDRRAARELFVEMYKEHGRILDVVESSNPREGGQAFWDYVDRVLMYPDGRTTVNLSNLTFNRVDLAIFWFLSADAMLRPAHCVNTARKDFPYYFPKHAAGHLDGPEAIPEMKRLFVAWLAGPRNIEDPNADWRMLATGFQLAAGARLKEARPVALRTALDPKQGNKARAAALLTLFEIGGPEDVEKLTPLITNDAVVYQPSPVRDPAQKVVIGDLALAACIRISSRNLADFGFPNAREAESDPSNAAHYGFRNDSDRAAARKKWADANVARAVSTGGKR